MKFIRNMNFIREWLIDMRNSSRRNYKTLCPYLSINSINKTFHHTKVTIYHTAHHTRNRIIP